MKKILFLLSAVFFIKLSGCIQTPEPDVPKRVSFLFNVRNMGESIVTAKDSVVVNEFKLVADKLNIELPDESILQTSVDALVFTYLTQFDGEDENVLSANIGFEDFDRFRGLELFVNQPDDEDNIQDSDFFGEEINFSFVMRGTYNNQDFTYRSDIAFTKLFDFGTVIELDNNHETLIVRVISDIREVLLDDSGNQILDPNNAENIAAIDSLFKQSIDIEASAADLF